MKRTICITLAALLFAAAVCTASNLIINRIVDHARHLRTEAIEFFDSGDVHRTEQTLVELAEYIADNQFWLEVFCDHDDLHDIKIQIIDAQASIEFGSREDFYQAIYRFGEALEHISDVENIRLSNLY